MNYEEVYEIVCRGLTVDYGKLIEARHWWNNKSYHINMCEDEKKMFIRLFGLPNYHSRDG